MRHILLLSALCLGTTAVCHADTVSTFALQNTTFADGATAAGTVTIDSTTGVFEFVNTTVKSGANTISFVGMPTVQSTFGNGTQYYEYTLDSQTNPQNAFLIDLPVSSLIGYTGGNLCSLTTACGGGTDTSYVTNAGGTTDRVSTGALAITPEPSSLVLLGTGLLGFVGAAKRRFSKSRA